MLYIRIKELAKKLCGSDKALGASLGLHQGTFAGYLKESRQNNLWPLLPQILTTYPQISRDWLYFGEGDMLEAPEVPEPARMGNRVWTSKFGMVFSEFCSLAEQENLSATREDFCKFLGVGSLKVQYWEKGNWPCAADLVILHDKLGFSYRWLITGEGNPFTEAEQNSTSETSEYYRMEQEIVSLRARVEELLLVQHDDMQHNKQLAEKLVATQEQVISLMANLRKFEHAERIMEAEQGECPALPLEEKSAHGARLDGEN